VEPRPTRASSCQSFILLKALDPNQSSVRPAQVFRPARCVPSRRREGASERVEDGANFYPLMGSNALENDGPESVSNLGMQWDCHSLKTGI
jgi:hypothetical protein